MAISLKHNNCSACKVIHNIVRNLKTGAYSDGFHGVTIGDQKQEDVPLKQSVGFIVPSQELQRS